MAGLLLQLVLLLAIGLAAGTVDAMAGGGGLLTLPALLALGLPPHLALGTNKGQSVFGSAASLARFARHGWVNGRRARLTFPAGLLGSLLGASLVLWVRPQLLRPVVLVMLVGAAVFLALRRPSVGRSSEVPRPVPPAAEPWAVGLAAVLGAYDGFFGPGVGTFLIVGFMGLLGLGVGKASAEAKVVNFASNLAAVVLFSARGTVLWRYALPMALGQLLGGTLGAHLAVRGGDVWIRRVVLLVVLALVAKLGWDVRQGLVPP